LEYLEYWEYWEYWENWEIGEIGEIGVVGVVGEVGVVGVVGLLSRAAGQLSLHGCDDWARVSLGPPPFQRDGRHRAFQPLRDPPQRVQICEPFW
jgi:hypothetical protein